jgi:hypothetical protein
MSFRYDFKDASEGIDKTVGGTEYTSKDLEMPEEFPELERPALRKIDKYCTPECPCCNLSKRYTQVRTSRYTVDTVFLMYGIKRKYLYVKYCVKSDELFRNIHNIIICSYKMRSRRIKHNTKTNMKI